MGDVEGTVKGAIVVCEADLEISSGSILCFSGTEELFALWLKSNNSEFFESEFAEVTEAACHTLNWSE